MIEHIETAPGARNKLDLYREFYSQMFRIRTIETTILNLFSRGLLSGTTHTCMGHEACAVIGDNNFLSAYVNIEYHNVLGSHNTFGPGVFTSSRAQIEDWIKFGTGVFIEPGVKIGANSIISFGSILTFDIPENSIVKRHSDLKIQKR